LMSELKEEINTSILLITHDFSTVAQTCDRVAVMYAGNLVEAGTVQAVFKDSKHPYTKGLLEAIPKLGSRERRLRGIEGAVPSLLNPPEGCRFHPRCPKAMKACKEKNQRQIEVETGHYVSCLLYGADAGR